MNKVIFCICIFSILIVQSRSEEKIVITSPDKVSDFELGADSTSIFISLPSNHNFTEVVWFVDKKQFASSKITRGNTLVYLREKLAGLPSGQVHSISAVLKNASTEISLSGYSVRVYSESPHKKNVGVFYYPTKDTELQLKRMTRGDYGGRQGLNLVITACDLEQIANVKKFTGSKIKCVVDVHSLAFDLKSAEEKVSKIVNSDLMEIVEGWYICDEPFSNKRDFKIIYDLKNLLDKIGKEKKKKMKIYADYGGVVPLEAQNGGYTAKKEKRKGFVWDGKEVQFVADKNYANGKKLYRGYGFFEEDVSMINFYGDAEALKKWFNMIIEDVKPEKINFVISYDWSEDKQENNAWMVERCRKIIEFCEKKDVSGYWFWPWATVPVASQNKTYKGLGVWWESDASDKKFPKRYANLIEDIP